MNASRGTGRRFAILLCALVALSVGPFAGSALASHGRGFDISWTETGTNAADFNFRASFARDRYSGTAPDGYPAVGDVIDENVGATGFDYGDGTPGTGQLQFRVIAINIPDNYLTAVALEPGSSTDVLLSHGYASAGPFDAFTSSCCNISNLNNNGGGAYSSFTHVDFANDNESPKTNVPPVVEVGNTGVQSFFVPAVDSGGQTLKWRLATDAEACGGPCSSGSPNPAGLAVDANSGQVTFTTTGLADGLYFASIVIEAKSGATVLSSTQATFLIRVRPGGGNNPPAFDIPPQPACGTSYDVSPGSTLNIGLQASDPDTGQQVTINNTGGLPPNATFNQTSGNPATGSFSFTPSAGQDGQDYIVTFFAQDNGSPAASSSPCSYTLRVRQAQQCPRGTPPGGTGCQTNGPLSLRVSTAGKVTVPVSCPRGRKARCAGKLSLQGLVRKKVSKSAAGWRSIGTTAKGFSNIRPGRSGKVKVRLTKRQFRAVKRLKRLRTKAYATERLSAGATIRRNVGTFILKAPKKKTR